MPFHILILPKRGNHQKAYSSYIFHFPMNMSETFRINVNMDFAFILIIADFCFRPQKDIGAQNKKNEGLWAQYIRQCFVT